MEKRKTDRYGVPLDNSEFLKHNSVASASDCTGLMPTNPYTEQEAESYGCIYDVAQSKVGPANIKFENHGGSKPQ